MDRNYKTNSNKSLNKERKPFLMRKSVILSIAILFSGVCFSQVKYPVKWLFSAKKINATTYEVHLTANVDEEWHIYSQTTPDGGPAATSVSFTKNPLIIMDGETREAGKLEQHFEPLFGVDVKQFSGKVDFVQTVKLKNKVRTSLNGTIAFMICNDHECMPPTKQKFSISLQ